MEVENRKNGVSGSNALASQVNPLPRERVKNPLKQGTNRDELRDVKNKKILDFLKINSCILAVGVLGSIVVFRYSSIYDNQKEIIALQENIQTVTEESEALSIKLLKFNNIAYIEQVATDELNMVKPKSTDAVYCDLGAVESIQSTNANDEQRESLLSKIKNFLFNY